MTTTRRRLEEIALGLAILALGAVFLTQAFRIPEGRDLVGPRSLPVLIAGTLSAGGVLVAVRGWLGHVVPAPSAASHDLLRIVLPGVAVALAFLWMWSAIGWTLASLLAAPIFFYVFGARGWRELILFPAGAVLVLYLIFYRLLGLWHGPGWLMRDLGLA